MDCRQCREHLDCYVDRELSSEASAAVDTHLVECAACARVCDRVRSLRRQVQRTVVAHQPPPELEARLREALRPSVSGLLRRRTAGVPWWLAAAAAVLVTVAAGSVSASRVQAVVVAALDRAIVEMSRPETVVLEGTVRCRDCDLKQQYGVATSCARIGHRGALMTADGRVWNIVEQESSEALVHDATLLGRRIRVRAQIFRQSGSLTVESFEILG